MRFILSAVVLGAIGAAAILPSVLEFSDAHAIAHMSPPTPMAQMRVIADSAGINRPFTVTAYIKDHKPGQVVRLIVPSGLRLVKSQRADRVIPEPGRKGYSQVSWRLTAERYGEFRLFADLDDMIAEEQISVRERSCNFGL